MIFEGSINPLLFKLLLAVPMQHLKRKLKGNTYLRSGPQHVSTGLIAAAGPKRQMSTNSFWTQIWIC